MILFPAIDLRGGRCVRLQQGRFDRETVYDGDPAAVARRFADAGCRWLHLVDLDGARSGTGVNESAIAAILASVGIPVQLGGGIRSLPGIEARLAQGVSRVILGTAALEDPALLQDAARRFAGRIAVAIDAREGLVATRGWTETARTSAMDFARRLEGSGVAAIIHTDVTRDGTGRGTAIEASLELAQAVTIPVIASGGVGSLVHLAEFKQRAQGRLAGIVVGRAIYEGLDLGAALALLESRDA